MATVDIDLAVQDLALVSSEPAEGGTTKSAVVPVEVSRRFSEGLDLLNHGEPSAAAACFEQIVEALPDFADAHVALGIADAVCGRIYSALDHLEEAARLEPDNFFAHFKLGQLCFKLHVPQRGYDEMRKALDCASSACERKLVGQLIHEEKQREGKSLARPTWNRPFSRRTLWLLGASVVLPILYMFSVYAR